MFHLFITVPHTGSYLTDANSLTKKKKKKKKTNFQKVLLSHSDILDLFSLTGLLLWDQKKDQTQCFKPVSNIRQSPSFST